MAEADRSTTRTRILCSIGRITLRNWIFASGFVSLSVCVKWQRDVLWINEINPVYYYMKGLRELEKVKEGKSAVRKSF